MREAKVYATKDSGDICIFCPPHMAMELGKNLAAEGYRCDFYGLGIGLFTREHRRRFGRPGMRKKRRCRKVKVRTVRSEGVKDRRS